MPSAPEWLQKKFPGDDQEALEVLEFNFYITRGGIIAPKDPEHELTKREIEAIDYLCYEWDYGYDPSKEE